MPYKLSATLTAHTSDVRAVAAPTNSLILSASRDTTAISWTRESSSSTFTPGSLLRAGTRYVNAIAYIPPSTDAPHGFAVTGGQDTVINVFSLDAVTKGEPEYSLIGHSENVCALDVGPDGVIISGSWDSTAKVWKNFKLVFDLKGHERSVWAVLALGGDQYLTGSADKTIKLWQQNKCLHTLTGHTDAVRGLALMPDIGFVSCSNDSEIRVWTLGGDPVYTLSGHTSFVYSLSVLPDGGIVSGGEDRSVRVWKDGELSQTIIHPAISVWAVASMPNGDIVSGCSDGMVRVFSEAEARWASAADLKEYDDQVASQALPSQQVGDVKKTDLPGPEALNTPGKKSGEVKMVKNNEVVEAHQWDSTTSSWTKIGEVVDAVGSGRKQLYEGREYDYVFDVDIQDGVPPLKLPYNANENPYDAAQKFLAKNELPPSYIDQVVQFITTNSSGVNLGSGSNNDYVDPFTGASRYQSSANSGSNTQSGGYMDPFTGASRYQASPAPAASAPSSEYMDPFTGASRYSGAPQPTANASAPPFQPVLSPVLFKQANVQAMQAKFFQFNEDLRNEISTSLLAMYPEELDLIDEAFVFLTQALGTNSVPAGPALGVKHLNALMAILERWPLSQRFPGMIMLFCLRSVLIVVSVIDLSRLVIAFGAGKSADPETRARFFHVLFDTSEWNGPWSLPLSKTKQTNVLLLLRTIANAFEEDAPISEGTWVSQILDALGNGPYEAFPKPQRVALGTILFNLSCAMARTPVAQDVRSLYLTILLGVLRAETQDSEASYRALVALGNTVHTAKSKNQILDASQAAEVRQVASGIPITFPEDRVRNVAGGIVALL
ncbi:hypothetical protein HWV62_39631 [Athelia sp. TMB]|nr:hypothetical protein HWV62_39631 [Athelia sp. TMB]